MRKLSLVVALASFAISLFAQKGLGTDQIRDYITRYQQIAMLESARSGIPASIILAQGIIESQYGVSRLATEANNHFGIKWKSKEDGDFISVYDDDYDSKGRHIQSRFIRYSSAEESYEHHTEFLKAPRYAKLFDYDRTDYRNWAHGLSSCHYATDPTYPSKLIRVIEQNKLYQFDMPMILSLEDEDEKPFNSYIASNNSTIVQMNNAVSNSEAAFFEENSSEFNTKKADKKTGAERPAIPTVKLQKVSEFYEIIPEETNNKGIDNKQTPPRSGRTAGGSKGRY